MVKNIHANSVGRVLVDTQNKRNFKPEWLSISDAVRVFGIGRSRLYEMMNDGDIKSVSIKKRGAVKGRRLISFDSLAEYFDQQANGKGGE